MTAMEKLQATLDERGVEHRDIGGVVEWEGAKGRICRAYPRPEPLTVDVSMLAMPPAQAVEATLGRGECCVNRSYTDRVGQGGFDRWTCKECAHTWWSVEDEPKWCPNCGRKVLFKIGSFKEYGKHVIAGQSYETSALKRENDKLRELVRDSLIGIDVYAEKYGVEQTYDDVNAHLDERIRKLGIEVKE